MTKEQLIQLELDLTREFRVWYHPEYISDEQIEKNISTQEGVVEMFRHSYEVQQKESTADVLTSEVMKLELWKGILETRKSLVS